MLLEKVFNYIKNHTNCTVEQISNEINVKGLNILAAINELQVRGIIGITPVALSSENTNSCYYFACAEDFEDNSEFCSCKASHCIFSDTEANDFGYWDTCCLCGKHLENGIHYYKYYDGEDHDDIDVF